jgi:ABC-type nitrate/sulfonate/bicarbonate transport system permease component
MARDYLPPALLALLAFGAWELSVYVFSLPAYLLPAPSRILSRMMENHQLLFSHAGITLLEVALGFGIALTFALLLGLLLFYSPLLERAFYPWLILSQNIPIFAIAPLLVIWLGFGIWPKVLVAALIVFFPMVVNTLDGLKSADLDLIDLLKIMGATRWQIMRKIRIPAALPFIFSGMKIGVTFSVMGAVIGEWIGGQQGLGYLMNQQKTLLHTDLVFAAIFWLAALAILLFLLVSLIERKIMPYRKIER